MTLMTGATTLTGSGPLTRADLDLMPDDGRRYELIDGVLVVSPSPLRRHQRAVFRLAIALEEVCPDDLEVLFAPFDVALAEDTVMIPDLIVARRADFTPRDLPTAPLLAVEILSPRTRRFDLTIKPARLAAAGCPSYWVVDPEVPSLTAFELRDGAYAELATVTADEEFTAAAPYAVVIRPADLVSEHRRR